MAVFELFTLDRTTPVVSWGRNICRTTGPDTAQTVLVPKRRVEGVPRPSRGHTITRRQRHRRKKCLWTGPVENLWLGAALVSPSLKFSY